MGLRTGSTHMRNRWDGLVARLIRRVVASLRAGQSKRRSYSSPENEAGVLWSLNSVLRSFKSNRKLRRFCIMPCLLPDYNRALCLSPMTAGIACQEAFLQWLLDFLMASLYPGSPNARKGFAAEMLLQLLDSLPSDEESEGRSGQASGPVKALDSSAWVLQPSIFEPRSVLALLGQLPHGETCACKSGHPLKDEQSSRCLSMSS